MDLLNLMWELVPNKKEEVRTRGMRFFANVNYRRASNVKALGKRIAAFFLVYRYFGYRYLPSLWLVFSSTALYRGLRRVKRRVLGWPEWAG
jgi:hypothetical protein